MAYFKQVTQLSPETYRMVPGKLVADWMTTKVNENAAFELSKTAYDVLAVDYNAYVDEWNAEWDETDWSLLKVLDYYFGVGLHGL